MITGFAMGVETLISLCSQLYAILDDERLEQRIRQESENSVYRGDLYLLYQRFRDTAQCWVCLGAELPRYKEGARGIVGAYQPSAELILGLNEFISEVSVAPNADLSSSVIRAVRTRGALENCLTQAYTALISQASFHSRNPRINDR